MRASLSPARWLVVQGIGLGVLAGCGAPGPTCDPPDARRTYLVSSLRFDEPSGTLADRAHGFDLDGARSDGAGTACPDLTPDYRSITTGDRGVDNGIAGIVRVMALLMDGVGARPPGADPGSIELAPVFARGDVLLAIDVVPQDDGVRIALHQVEIEGDIRLLDDRLAPGQRVRSVAELAVLDRTAAELGQRACRLEEVVPAFALPGDPGPFPPVDLARATHLRLFVIESGGLGELELGGTWSPEDAGTWALRLGSELSPEDAALAVSNAADVQPRADDPTRCERISFGAIGDLVQAVMIE